MKYFPRFIFLIPFFAASQPAKNYSMQLDSLFQSYFKPGEPGGAVLLVKNGELLYKKGFGIADNNTKEPITTETLFNVGSISKTFVAYGILKLASEGKLFQKSKKENYESEVAPEKVSTANRTSYTRSTDVGQTNDITVSECIALAKNAASFASVTAKDWGDVIRLSDTLAPAIGLARTDVETARNAMGALGSALAILGITEAFDRIRKPRAYLQALTNRAASESIDFVRMFGSLTTCRPRQRVV